MSHGEEPGEWKEIEGQLHWKTDIYRVEDCS